MASIDKRVVEMKFDNAGFERGVSSTLSMLDKLKSGLGNLGNSAKGLGDFKINSTGLNPLGQGIDAMVSKFSALQVAGVAAIGTIVSKATTAGQQLVSSFTVAPISQGFDEYQLKLNSTQTILANTARYGTDLATVNRELEALNEYSDKTIYNFAEMTKNASLFTNSGMKIEDATTVIKGFSNSAAASGTSAEGAAGAAYQLSQALSAGTIRLMDWRSLTNVGMGGKNMQDSVIALAEAMGTFEGTGATATEAAANFNGSLEKGWLSADVMSTYLKAMSGDMTEAEWAATGLSAAQIEVIKSQATMGLEAATKVRTLSALMNTLKESVASGWAQTFETVFGNFEEATTLFTAVNDTIGGMLSRSSDARNKMLDIWKEAGGRDALINSIKNAFNGLMSILKPVRDAFREVFPPMTGERLAQLTKSLEALTAKIKISSETANNLKSVFMGVFSVFKIAIDIVLGFGKALFAVLGFASEGGPGLLAIVGLVGDFVNNIQRFLGYTNLIENFFKVLLSPLALLGPLVGLVSDLVVAFAALASGDISGFTSSFKGAFSAFGDSIGIVKEKIVGLVSGLGDSFKLLGRYFSVFGSNAAESGNTVVAGIAGTFSTVSSFFSNFASDTRGTIENLITDVTNGFGRLVSFLLGFAADAQNRGNDILSILATIGAYIADFFGSLGTGALSGLNSVVGGLADTFSRLREGMSLGPQMAAVNGEAGKMSASFGAMQGTGAAVQRIWQGILDVFASLSEGIAPITSALGSFFVTLITKVRDWIAQMDMQDAVALLNTGFFIAFYIAMKRFFGKMSELADIFGRVGESITDAFDSLRGALKAYQQEVQASIILKIAIAVAVLVAAMVILARIDAAALAKSIAAMSVLFVQLGLMLKYIEKNLGDSASKTAAAGLMILALATAIAILAGAVYLIAQLSWAELTKGLIGVGVLLGGLILFAKFSETNEGGIKAGVGLILLAVAINILAGAIALIGNMDTGTLLKGVLTLVIVMSYLMVMIESMNKTEGIVKAAVGLVILAGALYLMAGAIVLFAAIDFATFAKGMALIAITLGLITNAMGKMPNDMLEKATAILILSAALTVLAGVIAFLGALPFSVVAQGLVAIAIALEIMARASKKMEDNVKGSAAILLMAIALGVLVPVIAVLGALPIEVILVGLAALAAALLVLGGVTMIISPAIPLIQALAIALLILSGAMALAGGAFFLFATGLATLAALGTAGIGVLIFGFQAFVNMLPLVAQQIGYAIVAFAKVMIEAGPKIIEALGVIIRALLVEAAKSAPQFAATAGAYIMAMINQIAKMVPQIATAGLNMIIGLLNAIKSKISQIVNLAIDIIVIFIQTIKGRLPNIIQAGIDLIVSFMNGLANGIRSRQEEIGRAGENIARALIDGIANGLRNLAGRAMEAVRNLANSLPKFAQKLLDINSPSRVFMEIGNYISQGLAVGITDDQDQVMDAVKGVTDNIKDSADTAVNSMRASLSNLDKIVIDEMDTTPTIRPILDLTDIQRQAGSMSNLFGSTPLAVDGSYANAALVSAAYRSAQDALAEQKAASFEVPAPLVFTQYNTSPKALAPADIYRQTQNQLSVAKGALTSNA